MPILIPSKNIYHKENPKVIDNLIDSVQVSFQNASVESQSNVSVANITELMPPIYDENGKLNEAFQKDAHSEAICDDNLGTYVSAAVAYADFEVLYYPTTINIPQFTKGKLTENIFTGVDENGNTNIKYRIMGTVTKGTCVADYNKSSNWVSNIVFGKKPTIETNVSYTIPTELKVTSTREYDYAKATAEVTLTNKSNVASAVVDRWDDVYYYISDVIFAVGYRKIDMGATTSASQESGIKIDKITGTFEDYVPTSIEITVNGDIATLSLSDGSTTYGSGENPYSLNGNELLQDSATTDGIPTKKYLANNVLEQYKNGKETAKILCDISDYYDYETQAKVISIGNDNLPMCFNHGDKVIPMVFGANGKDKPMSFYSDLTPKVFTVVGSDIIYDGAVWQEITLQEVTK